MSTSNTASTSSNFQPILNAALAEYTKKTGKDLRRHPLADKIDGCDSADSILDIFKEQAEAFDKFRNGDAKLFRWLTPVVKVLHALSTDEVLKDAVTHVFPPSKHVLSAIGILLSTAKSVGADYDALVEIFECIESFLGRFRIYTEIPLTSAMTEIITKIMVELLSVLSLATKQINQGRFKKYAKKFLGEKDIKSVLQRLERLTLEESKTTVAQTLDVVYGLANGMQVVMEDGKASTDDVQKALVIMQELAAQVNQLERDRLQENFRRWLSTSDPCVNQNIAQKAHHDGTATWFTQSNTFKNWKSTGSLMWIHGLPGSGKSVLCSTIVEEVRDVCQTGLATLAFFYFDFRDVAKQDVRSLLSSLLVQLSNRSDNFSQILVEFYSAHGRGSQQPSEGALVKCLKDMLTLPGQGEIYIVVDALDECPNSSGYPTPREDVLRIVQELVGLRLPHVHFCFLSRPEVDIRNALEDLAAHKVPLHEQAGQKRDILDYIKSVVYSDPKMRQWREEDKQLVIKTLTEEAGGMFRWVYCQIETLRRCFPASIRRTLDELPETLDGTYEQTLRGIDKEKRGYAHRLFQCLVVSKRPLRVEELAELFAIRPNVKTIPTFDPSLRPENPEEFVLSACSTLVAVINVDRQKIVQFSHFSVREYLTSDRIADSGPASRFHILLRPAHALLAAACLSILLQLDDRVHMLKIHDFPLALYAAQYWVDHAQFEDVSSDIQHGMEHLFDKNKPHFAPWLWLYNIDDPSPFIDASFRPAPPHTAPLYYAALCGFLDIAKHLIDTRPQDLNARGGKYMTPIHAALEKGYPSIAMLLLERGANMGSRDSRSQTPLHVASCRGYPEVVSLLIDRGAELNAEGFDQETSLYLALKEERRDVARLLLKHGADVNHAEKRGWTPLHHASLYGHNDIVQLLLDHGADTNYQDNRSLTPLHYAAMMGLTDIARSLLDHGADPNLLENCDFTALHHASAQDFDDIVQLLLNHGADTNLRDNRGWTALHHASAQGFNDIVQFLLDHGADPNRQENGFLTPLHHAAMGGVADIVENCDITALHHASAQDFEDIVKLLLGHGADPNRQDNLSCTPLHHAAMGGFTDIVRSLLDHGADAKLLENGGLHALPHASAKGFHDIVQVLLDHGLNPNLRDNRDWTALHHASAQGFDNIVQLLLDHRADTNLRHNRGWTALHHAAMGGLTDIVWSLLDHGADVKLLENCDLPALHHASAQGFDDIIQLLLDHGMDTNLRDNRGWTALHHASAQGLDGIVQLLFDHGADANLRDNRGWSALHHASAQGFNNIVQLLFDHGADMNIRDNRGWTALQHASAQGFDDVVHLLLNHGAVTSGNSALTPLHLASLRGNNDIVQLLHNSRVANHRG